MEEIYIICELKNFLEYERDRKGEFAIITLMLYAVKNEENAKKIIQENNKLFYEKIKLFKKLE